MLSYEFIDPDEQINAEHFSFVENFLKVTNRTQIGWHYFTDLSWLYSKISTWPKSFRILDAGGGGGPLQFLLAELGFDVVNIDMTLQTPSLALKRRYSTTFERLPSFQPTDYKNHLDTLRGQSGWSLKNLIRNNPLVQNYLAGQYIRRHSSWRKMTGLGDSPVGNIQWIVGNLCRMPEIKTGSFDAVVSLSALEHIPKEQLPDALAEIQRVLKPDARWAVTTSGTEKEETWFHEPSKGYCYSESDLRKIFNAAPTIKQNPSEILHKYKENSYLKNNLAVFYFKSGSNGMPWGKWEPQYIPVGLCN